MGGPFYAVGTPSAAFPALVRGTRSAAPLFFLQAFANQAFYLFDVAVHHFVGAVAVPRGDGLVDLVVEKVVSEMPPAAAALRC